VVFHKQMKTLCKMAEIDELVTRFKTKDKKKGNYKRPKVYICNSPIMRRSFASNYYRIIETPLLLNITGHSKERAFLTYITRHQNKDILVNLYMQQAGVIW
jgi:hypothetical protein